MKLVLVDNQNYLVCQLCGWRLKNISTYIYKCKKCKYILENQYSLENIQENKSGYFGVTYCIYLEELGLDLLIKPADQELYIRFHKEKFQYNGWEKIKYFTFDSIKQLCKKISIIRAFE